ncbi:MFS transporter [Uliginosibacterium paludis]|uniref:MFS transporter n=1 Tax=Uliginosibacterium paludis TaxID=1615952 RepID=A0ABV2CNW8_9RHOO
MNSATSTTATGAPARPAELDPMLVLLLACAAGLTCAALYYNQPILGLLAGELDASPTAIGRIPTLTQIGYTIGILLLAPLGDRYDRRRVILVKLVILAAGLFAMALTQSLAQLCAASLAIGAAASVAQDCVPAAATLAPESRRGKIVGHVMMGLLLGILLSRVVSGTVAAAFGWRTMFVLGGIAVLSLALIMQRRLPAFAPTTREPYLKLLGSLLTLCRRHPALRRAAFAQLCLSAAFSAFWSTLAVMLHQPPFSLGSAAAGAFGLAGAVGAVAAPMAGHFADRRGPEPVTRLGAVLVIASFAAFAIVPENLWLLIAGTVLFDLGVQASLIAHQSIIYGLEPAARSRLNAVLIGSMFIGMSAGSALGSYALANAGWRGVALFAAACGVVALITRLWPARKA